MSGTDDSRQGRRDYTKPHRLFIEDTPAEVRSILEEAASMIDLEGGAVAPPQEIAWTSAPSSSR